LRREKSQAEGIIVYKKLTVANLNLFKKTRAITIASES